LPARTRTTRPVAARAVAGRIGLAAASEVAAYLGKSEQTLANWRWQRKGPRYTGKGRGLRYDWADVDAWLKSQSRGAA
jgi:helix-turn-helix protein